MKNPFVYFFGRANRRETAPATQTASTETREPSRHRLGQTSLILGASPLQISTVYCCVNAISNTIASLPCNYEKKERGIYVPQDGSFARLLNLQPNEDYNAFDFLNHAVQLVLLSGNAYIIPVWSEVEIGEPIALILCHENTVCYDSINRKYTIYDPENGINGVYDENQVIHLKNFTRDGKNGVSVLTYARMTLDIASTGENETLNRFANGGNIRGIVSNDTSVRGFGEYADNELKKTAESIDERFQSGERIVNLPGQAQFKQISLSSVDMEFLGSRKYGVREICRFFGVPPTFVFDDTSNNYKSAEMANISFLTQTINPMLTKFEQEFQRKLIAPSRYGKYRFKFDRRALYAADLLTEADYMNRTIQSGVYTINDWRRYANKPAVEGGDRVLISANLKSLDEMLTPSQNTPTNNE